MHIGIKSSALRKPTHVLMIAFSLFASACLDAPKKPQPPRANQEAGAAELDAPAARPTPTATVLPTPTPQPVVRPTAPTFVRDVLPILSASDPQRIYRCTVCHATFGDYDVVAKTAVVESMIRSMENGRMPANGDRVKPADLNVIRAWLAVGMPKE